MRTEGGALGRCLRGLRPLRAAARWQSVRLLTRALEARVIARLDVYDPAITSALVDARSARVPSRLSRANHRFLFARRCCFAVVVSFSFIASVLSKRTLVYRVPSSVSHITTLPRRV